MANLLLTQLIEATILGGQTGMKISYFDQNGTKLDSPLPNPFVTGTQNISVSVENQEMQSVLQQQ
jgi:hypothetical protein